MARPQRTIREPQKLSGRALFSGREVTVQLLPAETGTGFLFVRTDLPDNPVIPATLEALGDGFRCTSLSWHQVEVKAVEHLLSACVGLQVDNLIIEIDGDEMPALGGCAGDYARALMEAGIEEQSADRALLKLERPVTVARDQATIVALPDERGLTVSYVLEFDDISRPTEAFSAEVNPEAFMERLAPARTFGFEDDVAEFERLSLGGGVSDQNVFILWNDGTVRQPRSLEPAELRFPEEAARHKIVDLLGDMALANTDVQARIVAVRAGHRLNAEFATRLVEVVQEEHAPEEYLDVREIQRVLPHRYPFLMVDRILRVEGESKIVGLKNVSVNEPYFQGHYPDYPILPGVLQLEALAQTGGVLLLRRLEHTGKVALLVSMDDVRMRRPVRPGDQLVLEAEALRMRERLATVRTRATVRGEVACEAVMSFMLVDADAI